MPDDFAKRKLTIVNLPCEVSKTLKGGDCERAGEAEFGDVLLCRSHASQLEAQDKVSLWVGIVSSLELSLRSIPLRKDRDLALLLRAQLARAKRELAYAREDLKQLADVEEEDVS
jgi:hypothetical protein